MNDEKINILSRVWTPGGPLGCHEAIFMQIEGGIHEYGLSTRKALGDKVKAVREELFEMLEDSQKLAKQNIKTNRQLVVAISKVDNYRNLMEAKMFKQVKPHDKGPWFHVFY